MKLMLPATAASLMVVFATMLPNNLGKDTDDHDKPLSPLVIRSNNQAAPTTPLSPEEACKNLDESMKNGVYAALEEFNEKVGTSFGIISDGTENGYIPAPSNEFPHTVDTGIAAAYNAQVETLHNMITQAREISEPPCAMSGSGNALFAFAKIAWLYEFIAEAEARNRREGIIIPEMINRSTPRLMI